MADPIIGLLIVCIIPFVGVVMWQVLWQKKELIKLYSLIADKNEVVTPKELDNDMASKLPQPKPTSDEKIPEGWM